MNWENETGTFALGDFAVEKGGVIREARLAWQRFGTLNDKRDNLILYPRGLKGHVLAYRPLGFADIR